MNHFFLFGKTHEKRLSNYSFSFLLLLIKKHIGNTFQSISEWWATDYLLQEHKPSLPLQGHSFGLLLILVHLLVV